MNDLITRLERATPSRWIAFLSAFGMISLFMLASAILTRNGAPERLGHFVMDIGLFAAALTWFEVRRFRDIAAALRAHQKDTNA